MPRYLTQDLFDIMAISQAMAELRASPELHGMFAKAINNYKRSYPDEDFNVVVSDLKIASKNVDKIAGQLYEELFGSDRSDKEAVYFSILKRLSEMVRTEARKKQPFLKRILGGAYFNYESSPILDRVERSRQNISLAGMMILAGAHT